MAAATLCALFCGESVFAGAFSIAPIRAELSSTQRTQALTVKNEQDTPVTVELHAQAWSQEQGEDRLSDTRDVLVTPPVFVLAGHGEQIVRVALRRDADLNRELTYRLIVQEVPAAAPSEFVGLRVALRLSLPIFVRAREHAQDDMLWRATTLDNGKVRIDAVNRGSAHLQVTDFTAQLDSEGTRSVHAGSSRYLLAGSHASWTLPAELHANNGTSLMLRGNSDRGEFSAEVPLERH